VPARPPPRDFGLVGFDHVDIRVRDRDKARRFFVEQLGMDVIGEGTDHTFLLFGDQVLGLHDAKEGEAPSGVDHIAIRVSEWTGLRNRVARARVTITGEKERNESRSLFLRGPEGLRLELIWRPDPHVHSCEHPRPPPPPPAEDDDE
jgi:catechol 2,3-dioxygenase-like lactoylglutathione lyase family enzyme